MKNTWKKWMAVTCAMMMTICPLAVTAASGEGDAAVTVETQEANPAVKLATPTDLQPVVTPAEPAEEPAAEAPESAAPSNETELVDIEEYETPLGLDTEDEAQILTSDDILSKEDLPDKAVLLAEILDDMNEERSIEVYISYEGEEVHFGDSVTLYAILKGYENCEFTVQWQVSHDDLEYTDVAGENGLVYTFEVTEDNYTDFWRLAVIITAVEVPDEMISDLT